MDPSSPHPAPASIEYLERHDAGLFKLLRAEVESLKELAKRTQVKGLKECVDQIHSIIGSIENNNTELKVARSQQSGNKLLVVDAKKVVTILTENLRTAVNESNKPILDAISSVEMKLTGVSDAGGTDNGEVKEAVANLRTMLQKQGEKMDVMAERGIQSNWTDVVKKKGKKKNQDAKPVDKPAEQATTRRRESRPPAIMVDITKEDFPALAQKIRGGVDKNVIGDRVTGMRQARSGGLLIEVRGDQKEVEEIRAEIARSAGSEVAVRSLQRKRLVELRDLDEWTSKEEVSAKIASFTGEQEESFRVLSIRKQYGGVQVAVISAAPELAEKLVEAGRLTVGMVSCRTRYCEGKVKCYRCLGEGHMAKDCKGEDRSGCCRECGVSGHRATKCDAPAADRVAFRAVLGGRSLGVTTSSPQ